MSSQLPSKHKAIAAIFYLLLIVFLVVYLLSIDISRLLDVTIRWEYFIIASILGLLGRYFGAFIWLIILSGLGAKDVFSQKAALLEVYAKSWLGRYIPGKAAWILGKIYFASQLGVSKNKLAVSSVLEGALQIGTKFILAFVILLFDARIDFITDEARWLLGVFIVIGIFTLIPSIFNRIIGLLYRLYKKKPFDAAHAVDNNTLIKSAMLYTAASFISALSFFFIAMAVYGDLTFADIYFVSSVTILASAISMLAVFTPSGLGVKEGIQIALLSIIMPTEIAFAIAVATRLWSVLMDFIFFGSAKYLLRIARHNSAT